MIRLMTPADLSDAMRLKEAAGWNQTVADWETLLALAPDACWVDERDGQAAGSVTALAYGHELAWIGMALVLPEYRRQGIGRGLLQHAIADCDRRGVARIGLDATDAGRPLYASLGFSDDQPIERWVRQPLGAEAPAPPELENDAVDWSLDRRAFGADRRALVERLAAVPGAQTVAEPGGFALSRPGSTARQLGPVVAAEPGAARRVIAAQLAADRQSTWFWDILPAQAPAADLARELGFEPARRLTRMLRPGGPTVGDPALIWAAAGFELG